MIRDRIFVGIRDDATRRKLLRVRDLMLLKAIAICKMSEAAGRQLKAMASADEVHAINKSKDSKRDNERPAVQGRGDSSDSKKSTRPCKYCNRRHEHSMEACPAYGKNHFESVGKSKPVCAKQSFGKQHVCDIETDDEELLTLSETDRE